jgi:probable phosphoglycerate mutase
MVKRIYIIRHGQTDYNLKRIIQGGRVDTDLNDKGRQQADQFYQFYRNIPFDKIYTSALKRTLQTVEPFRKEGIPIESYSELNEIDWGKDEGISLDEPIGLDYYRLLEQWRLGQVDMKIEGGESPIEVSIRLKKMMDLILFRR